jgi:hypothetical protein
MTPELSPDGRTVTVRVPLAIRKRGGHKQVVTPAGSPAWAPGPAKVDSTLVKVLARAYRWRRLLEDGGYATIEELARAEKINVSYVSRVLRLTLLAPDLVERILDGAPSELTLPLLFKPLPFEWQAQRLALAK